MGKIRPTEEQYHAIRTAAKGTSFVLDAPAGSGKSATARGMSTQIDGQVLYLVYNRLAKDDAVQSFERAGINNVRVRTTASLGWHFRKATHADRMDFKNAKRVKARETAKIAGITDPIQIGKDGRVTPDAIARMAISAIETYCRSGDDEIGVEHVKQDALPEGIGDAEAAFLREHASAWAWRIWQQAIQPGSEHRYTMLYALKELTLRDPQLGYDAIIVDEAQDSNGAVHRLVSAQKNSQKIIIGDPAQAVNQWNGAVDIMSKFTGPRLQLTQSFRFGEAVAEEARKWLEHTGTGITIKGLPAIESAVSDRRVKFPNAVLCRTNGEVMRQAMQYLDEGRRVAVVGGTEKLESLAYAASDLRAGRPTTHPELVAFSDWSDLTAYAEEPGGGDLKVLVKLVNIHGVGGILNACSRLVPESRPEWGRKAQGWQAPEILISTAHKTKGMEWGKVQIADDFEEPEPIIDPVTQEERPGKASIPDAMLHYVTVTRAKRALGRGSLGWSDRYRKRPTGV